MPAGKEVADSDLRPAITLGAARGTCCVTNRQLTTYGKTPEAQIVQKPAGQVDGRHPHSEHFDGSPPGRGGTLEQRAETVQALPRLARHAHCTLVQSLPQGQGLVQRLAEAAITALPSLSPRVSPGVPAGPETGRATGVALVAAIPERGLGEICDLAGRRRTQAPPTSRARQSVPATAGPAPTAAGSSPRHNPARNSAPAGSAAAPAPHDAAGSNGRKTAAASAAGRPPPPSRNTPAGALGTVPIFGQRREAAARKWDCPPWLAQKPGQPREMSRDSPQAVRGPAGPPAATPAVFPACRPARRRLDRPGRGSRRRGRRRFALRAQSSPPPPRVRRHRRAPRCGRLAGPVPAESWGSRRSSRRPVPATSSRHRTGDGCSGSRVADTWRPDRWPGR